MTTRDISKKKRSEKVLTAKKQPVKGTSPTAGKMVSKEFFLTMRM